MPSGREGRHSGFSGRSARRSRGGAHKYQPYFPLIPLGPRSRISKPVATATLIIGEARTPTQVKGVRTINVLNGWRPSLIRAANTGCSSAQYANLLFTLGVDDLLPNDVPAITDPCWSYNPANGTALADMVKDGLKILNRKHPSVTHHNPYHTTAHCPFQPVLCKRTRRFKMNFQVNLYVLECMSVNPEATGQPSGAQVEQMVQDFNNGMRNSDMRNGDMANYKSISFDYKFISFDKPFCKTDWETPTAARKLSQRGHKRYIDNIAKVTSHAHHESQGVHQQ